MYKRTVETGVNNYANKWTCLLFCKILVSVKREDKLLWSVDVLSYYFVVPFELSHHQRLELPSGMHCFYLKTSVRPGMSEFFFSVFLLYPQLSVSSELHCHRGLLLFFCLYPSSSLGGLVDG